MGNYIFGSRKGMKFPFTEELLEISIERMRKIHQILREQEDHAIQSIHENIGNSNCLASHITWSILYALGNMIEN